MRMLSLPWLVGAAGARLMSEPNRILLRVRTGKRRGTSVAAGIDDAVARDDLAEAERLLALVRASDPQFASLSAAVLLVAGEISRAESTANTASRGRGRARRVLRQAGHLRAELGRSTVHRGALRRPRANGRSAPSATSSRVLVVVKNSLPQVQAGYTLRTQEILRTQLAAGRDVRAVTRLGFPLAQGHLADRVEVVDGVEYHRLFAVRGTDVEEYARRLTSFARAQGIDLLHSVTDHVNGHASRIAAEALDVPFVYEVRGFLEDSWACRHGGDARASVTDRYRWARERETAAMLAADAVITLGRAMADEIVSRGVPAERIHLVPNGVHDAYLVPRRDPAQLRAQLGLHPKRLWVGAVTSVHSYEGLDVLVDAVALAREGGIDVGAVIVGDGPGLDELRKAVPADGSVVSVGRVPQRSTIDWLDALDAVVIPRQDHRVTRLVTPLKPVEALARGRLVIASDLPALREATGEHARFVRAGDVHALAAELSVVEEHRGLGAAGREWVKTERQWSTVCLAYDDAYAAASSR